MAGDEPRAAGCSGRWISPPDRPVLPFLVLAAAETLADCFSVAAVVVAHLAAVVDKVVSADTTVD